MYALTLASASALACAAATDVKDDRIASAPTPLTYEQFLETLPRFGDTGRILEDDILLATEEHKRGAYADYVARLSPPNVSRAALTVNTVSGSDDLLGTFGAQTIHYCVSSDFDSVATNGHAMVVAALADAASQWSAFANVNFLYLPAEDGNCKDTNSAVWFNVSPTTVFTSVNDQTSTGAIGYLWPSATRADRQLLINSVLLGSSPPYTTLAGWMRHELGHVLGFRHEHLSSSPPPSTSSCLEPGTWRSVTPYDSLSVMFRPASMGACGGSTASGWPLSYSDKSGASYVYPSQPRDYSGRVTGDFNGDGYDDLAILYDYGSNDTALLISYNTGTALGSPTQVWRSGAGNWNASASQMVVGNFDNDAAHQSDIAIFYDYGGSTSGLFVFRASNSWAPEAAWNSGTGNWNARKSRLTAGDYNGDGLSDIAVLYDYGSSTSGLWRFASSLNGFSQVAMTPSAQWTSASGAWSWQSTKLATGKINADSIDDVLLTYDYGSESTGILLSSGNSGTMASPTTVWGPTGANTWAWARSRVVVGNFGTNEKVAILYDWFNEESALYTLTWGGFTFNSGANQRWRSTGWSWNRMQIAPGDFNADGKTDIGVWYGYEGSSAAFRFVSSGASFTPASADWTSTGVLGYAGKLF